MKQKLLSIYKSFAVYFLLLALLLTGSSAIFSVTPKVAQANEICSGIIQTVAVYDTTPNPDVLLGNFMADGNDELGHAQVYNLTVPYNHQIRYTFTTQGTPSFTANRTYNTVDGFSHSQHSNFPNPANGMSNTYTAPPITSSGTYMSRVTENDCTENGSFIGDQSALVLINLTTSGGPGGPELVTKTTDSNLAVLGSPQVSLLANGVSRLELELGDTAELTWNTRYVNPGNSCVASNNNSDNLWDGSKNGPNGGRQNVGPFITEGEFTYSIYCRGYSVNSPPARVTIVVNGVVGGTFSCALVSGGNHLLERGQSGSAIFRVNPQDGFAEPVTFSVDSITPVGGNQPSVNIANTGVNPNPIVSPYNKLSLANISTTQNTSTGQYQIRIKGVSQSGASKLCPIVTVTVTRVVGQDPYAEIYCDTDSSDPCEVDPGGSSMIRWTSRNTTICTIYKNGTPWDNSLNGIRTSGPLIIDTQFDITCDDNDPNTDPASDSVRVTVRIIDIEEPLNVTANAGANCETAYVTWRSPRGPKPDFYQVYRSTSNDPNSFQPVGGLIPHTRAASYRYDDLAPLNPTGINYYGVKALRGAQSSNLAISNGVSLTRCAPNLSLSDKDLYRVDNNIHTAGNNPNPPTPCNSTSDLFTLPNNGIFKTGSRVYFRINVCNSGNQKLTGLELVEEPSATLTDLRIENMGVCATGGQGTAGNPYKLRDLDFPANPSNPTVCVVELSAKITAPVSSPAGTLHRFWNKAIIYSDQQDRLDPPGPKIVRTRPYLFSDTGKPVRNETPQ